MTTLTVSAAGARVSGVKSSIITVSANSVTVDHCTVTGTSSSGSIIASGVTAPRILSNTVNGYIGPSGLDSSGCCYDVTYAIKVTNCASPVVDGNTAYNSYYNIYMTGDTNIRLSYNDILDGSRKGRGIEIYVDNCNGGRINNNQIENYPYLGSGDTGSHENNHDGMGIGDNSGTQTATQNLIIDHNLINGHYYPLKVYGSTNDTLMYNQVHGGGFELRVDFWCNNVKAIGNQLEGDTVHGVSPGIYVGDGSTNCLFQNNEVWNNEYGIEIYSYASYHLGNNAPAPSTNIVFKDNYMHNNKVFIWSAVQSGVSGQNTYTLTPSSQANPTPTPVYTPHMSTGKNLIP